MKHKNKDSVSNEWQARVNQPINTHNCKNSEEYVFSWFSNRLNSSGLG